MIVLGLGNPGARYRQTRHNLGFWVVEQLARRSSAEFEAEPALGGKARIARATLAGCGVILAKPRTYMNRSGRAAIALCREYDAVPENLLVVYDDADLALGRIRVRPGGRPGGHNGVRSVIDALQTDRFPRVRLGVRGEQRGERELADYVLDPFEAEEFETAQALSRLGADAVEAVLRDGVTAAMNEFNGKHVVSDGDGGTPEN